MKKRPTALLWQLPSALPGALWPALAAADNATVLAMLFQLEHFQWLPAAQLLERQLQQLDVLLRHAYATVPHYRRLWGSVLLATTLKLQP